MNASNTTTGTTASNAEVITLHSARAEALRFASFIGSIALYLNDWNNGARNSRELVRVALLQYDLSTLRDWYHQEQSPRSCAIYIAYNNKLRFPIGAETI